MPKVKVGLLLGRLMAVRDMGVSVEADLRTAAVAAREGGATLAEVAEAAGVSIRTLRRWLAEE